MGGWVEANGESFPLIDLAPGGGAFEGHDCWWEDDVRVRLRIPYGNYEFFLPRLLRCCYIDPARNVTGFELVGVTTAQSDIVVGLLLGCHGGTHIPPVMARANTRALSRLTALGQARCLEGGWWARRQREQTLDDEECAAEVVEA
jgi:hypothetical protein